MDIRASEEILFTEWHAKRPGFVADGVVDENAYLLSSPKLLLVLQAGKWGSGFQVGKIANWAILYP